MPVPGGILSGESIPKTSTLEEDYAVLPSSPEYETALLDQVAIKAINPGYTTTSGKNTGELIELINMTQEEVDLSHLAIVYTSKPSSTFANGKSVIIYEFPEGSAFVGETILLRYDASPEVVSGQQDLTYSTSLAMAGKLSLVTLNNNFDKAHPPETLSDYGDIVNEVCWFGGEDCLPVFSTTVKSRSYTTIVRNEDTGEYEHVSDYIPTYDSEYSGLFLPEPVIIPEELEDQGIDSTISESTDSHQIGKTSCNGLELSEIFTYYENDPSEQFIEIYNSSNNVIAIDQCSIRYKNKLYPLSVTPKSLASKALYVYKPTVALTKNPTSENVYELIDMSGNIVDALSLPHGQKKSAAYALMVYDQDGLKSWQITYHKTPGEPNIYQEFQTCPAGKIINEATGNCVNISKLTTTLKDCGQGKYRNPETGRCKKIEDESDEPAPCKEGYERNPETGRCRKIKQNNGTDYPVVPVTGVENASSLVAVCAVVALILIGTVYTIFQFRKEIIYFFRKNIFKK